MGRTSRRKWLARALRFVDMRRRRTATARLDTQRMWRLFGREPEFQRALAVTPEPPPLRKKAKNGETS